MIDPLLIAWIFAQVASSPALPTIITGIIGPLLTAPATVALVRFLDRRAHQKAVNERATIDADKALRLAEIEARRAHEEEVTGQHELARPFAEQTAIAEREERRETQRIVRDLDVALASAMERIAVLGAEVTRLTSRCETLAARVESLEVTARNQAESLIREYADHEKTIEWFAAKLGERPPRKGES